MALSTLPATLCQRVVAPMSEPYHHPVVIRSILVAMYHIYCTTCLRMRTRFSCGGAGPFSILRRFSFIIDYFGMEVMILA